MKKDYIVFIIGLIFFGFGISFDIKLGYGNNPMGVFITSITEHVLLSVGIYNITWIICNANISVVFRKNNYFFKRN